MQIIEKIEKLKYDEKSKANEIIAKLLQTCYAENTWLSAKEVSKKCFVSESTLTVFAKKTGCKGYREMITILKLESARKAKIKFDSEDGGVPEEILDEFKESVLDYVNDLESETSKMIYLADTIKKGTGVQIIGSWILKDELSSLADYLKLKRENVHHIKLDYGVYLGDRFKRMTPNDVWIIFLAGPDNEAVLDFYNRGVKGKFKNVFLFATEAQRFKIEEANEVISIDSNHMPNQLIFRKLTMRYLFTQLFLLI